MSDDAVMQRPDDTPEPNAPGAEAQAQPLPSLIVSGVVLNKAQLIKALRLYLPGIVDFAPLPDGQHFGLLFGHDGQPRRTGAQGE